MSPLLTQLMQQLAFSAGRNSPDLTSFDNMLRSGDLIDEYGRPVNVSGERIRDPKKRPPLFRVRGPSIQEEQQGFFSVPPEQIPESSPVDQSINEVQQIAAKLRGLPTMASEKIYAESMARKNLLDERDQINSGLIARNAGARSGRESAARPQSLEQQLVKATQSVKLPSSKDRLNEIVPQEPGSVTTSRGASGNSSHRVRLSDGSVMVMGPDAYRGYTTALSQGLDEKSAIRGIQKTASEKQATEMANRRARESVRTKGAMSLSGKPGLQDAITPQEVDELSLARTARLADQQATIKARRDAANPFMAMLRNDGTDSPIAQQFMLQQMGMRPDDAASAALRMAAMKQQGQQSGVENDLRRAENDIRREDIASRADNTKAMKEAANLQAKLKIIEAEPDPIRRQQMMDIIRSESGLGSAPMASGNGNPKPAVTPTAPPMANATSLSNAVLNRNMSAEEALNQADLADSTIPYDPSKPRVKIGDLLRKKLADQAAWDSYRAAEPYGAEYGAYGMW